jgi:penicillin-binding protein 2
MDTKTNPFEAGQIESRKIKRGKNLSFDEAFMGIQNHDADVLDNERDDVNYRMLAGVVLILFSVLLGRVAFLQAVKGSDYRALAEGNKLRVQYVLAPRGLLLDQYGKVIAGNTPSFELVVTPFDLPKDEAEYNAVLSEVARIVGAEVSVFSDLISKMDPNSFQVQTLQENITKDQALVLITKASDLKGFIVQDNAIRDYKEPFVFANLIGYTGKITADELANQTTDIYAFNDYIGKTGIELQYEQYLRGIAGKRQTEIDAQGSFKNTLAEIPAIPGSNVKLNIDYDLQKVLYDNLQIQMKRVNAPKAAAVATNPKTGEVLALISLPSYDNNLFARGISQEDYSKLSQDTNFPLLNRAIAGQYPPGSTIKPVMALAALSEGVVTPQTKILDDGVIRVGTFTFFGYDHNGLGVMDLASAVARSSDIYF